MRYKLASASVEDRVHEEEDNLLVTLRPNEVYH